MNTTETKEMVLEICNATIAAKEELCRLDGHVGDGDHGFTVERGFTAVKKMIESEDEAETPAEVFEAVGDELADTMGGAIGLIIGGLFTGGAEEMGEADELDAEGLYALLSGGLEEIKAIGGAKEGDRTLIDALSPACDAYKEALDAGSDMGTCIAKAADAAKAGAEATANMVAKKGRAKFLQEGSKGFVDAGSVTMSIIIKAMSDYINK
jgi:dihydroxyacetone kinase phosphoprotein-dependent L subunit